MSFLKSKEFRKLEEVTKLSAEIKSIDVMVKFLKKRKLRLLKKMGIDTNGTITNWLYHYGFSQYNGFYNNNLNRRQIWDGIT